MTKEDLEKEFPITNVCRQDLVDACLSREVVESLSDEDMLAIARSMEKTYVALLFWESLRTAFELRLARRQLSFYRSAEEFAQWVLTLEAWEIHSDGEEERRLDVNLYCVPPRSEYLILQDGLVYAVVSRAEEDADFKFQSGESLLYARYCWDKDEASDPQIVEFGRLVEAVAWVRQH